MAQPATNLLCPKCKGSMRNYERNGVTVDQCEECRGIFLDRGELEQLIDAEAAYYTRDSRARQDDFASARRPDHESRGDHHGTQHGRHDSGYGRRKRGGFLSELFD